MIRVALLGSGQGTIARAVVMHAQSTRDFRVELLVTTTETSGFPGIGREFGIDCSVVTYNAGASEEFSSQLIHLLRARKIDLLVLAGFTRLLPATVILAMDGRVINTHPGPLPEFGGKGMYGLHVHRAVLESGRTETAITIHWVTEHYDDGAVIAVQTVPLRSGDTPEVLQQRAKEIEAPFVARTVSELAEALSRGDLP